MENNMIFNNTFNYKVIYVFKIYDNIHRGILKVGESTLKSNKLISELSDNSEELNVSARNRIRQYTNTIGVQEELLYTTLAINNKNKIFKDKDVHKVLRNSGIKRYDFNNDKNPEEWFEIDLNTAINAINAVKEGRKALNRTEVIEEHEDIEFRPEQILAIEQTLKKFEVTDRMLWNAKMRFGKTLSTLEVIKRMSKSDKFNLSRAIILTHRPVVDEGWFEDFTKIFYNDDTFLYGSKKRTNINELIDSGKKFIYFASMQDLRESNKVGGIYLKNDEVFNLDWDLIVIDEAHEGIKTELGKKVLEALLKSDMDNNSKQLHLSGTPFNLLSDFESKEIYTWDYIMEQKAKYDWEINHPFEPNPYEDLPKLNILTYNLEDYLPSYSEVVDKAFNFREFFRVWTGEPEKDGKELLDESKIGRFVHEDDVNKFLNLLTKQDEKNNYPFSKKEYIDNFRHSFWILPGVKEARALKELMLKNEVFSMFDEIVNVAGTGDDNGDEALEAVYKAIGDKPEETYTITLSCGKLTTGVTVKAWSAVLYLAGSYSTSASSYLQTIFRVQSPANFGGKQKSECYVFDFAPDRTLKMIAQAGDLSIRAGSIGSKEIMKQFLNYCPVISVKDSEMLPYNVENMLQQLKQAYIERVVDNGFDDVKMYNDELYKLDEDALSKFEKLKGIIGTTKQKKKINDIDINNQGFSDEEWETVKDLNKTKKRELTEEQKRLLELKREKDKQRSNAISILRGISIRIPLLIYGADINDNEEITINNFTDIVDDISWEEFMPNGVTKEMFKDFSKYYDNEIFIGAGHRIRNIAKHADTLAPVERAIAIADIFSTFRNPDKETVLTPWKTVNMHMGDTIGGYNFYDEKYLVSIEEPRLINNGNVTHDVLFNTNSKILELNSKTGLYPLYVTVSLFKQRCLNTDSKKLTDELVKALWDRTVDENIFVVCKTKMAKSITKRTLIGYRNVNTNIINYENINDLLFKDLNRFKAEVLNQKKWKKDDNIMKFNAIIGNPPYQQTDGGAGASAKPVYNLFFNASKKLSPNYISMIMPSRWMTGGKGLDNFRYEMINDKSFEILHDYFNAKECFSNVEIKGGVCYFLWNKNYRETCNIYTHLDSENIIYSNRYLKESEDDEIFIRESQQISIKNKIDNFEFVKLASARKPYGLCGDVFTNPQKYDLPEFYDEKLNNVYSIVGLDSKNKRTIKYAPKMYPFPKTDMLHDFKLFVPRNYGNGSLGEKPSNIILASPNMACTETFIQIGPFENKNEAMNCLKYMNTKFFRLLVGIKKHDQGATRSIYNYVPIQNFKNNSDVNWNNDLNDINNQLYKKYNLSKLEIEYIENSIDN